LNGGETLLQPRSRVAMADQTPSAATVTTVRALQTPLATTPVLVQANPEQPTRASHQKPIKTNQTPQHQRPKPAAASLKSAKSKPAVIHQQLIRSAKVITTALPRENSASVPFTSTQEGQSAAPEPIPTQAPPAFEWKFAERSESHSEHSSTVVWTWKLEAGRYESRFEAQSPAGLLWRRISQGGWDAFGLAPERFTDEHPKSGLRATNFQQAAQTVTFSGPSVTQTLAPGLQDPLSALVQFIAILRARAEAPRPGHAIRVQVVGLRADRADWVFRFIGEESLERPSGPQMSQHWQREPLPGFEGGLELWLDAHPAWTPLRLRMQQTVHKQPFVWELIEASITP
jgi:hypothetical protein